tara:strand:- start:4624 stop:4869 length:246 start_codon:yes stop_codon:yes gene_type:complete
MIPDDPNFKKDFSAVLQSLDDLLKKHKKVNSATFSIALSTFLTRHLMITSPNDFVIIQTLMAPYLETRRKQISDEQKKTNN